MTRFASKLEPELAHQCVAWREKLEVWASHKFTAELDAIPRMCPWDILLHGWLKDEDPFVTLPHGIIS